MEVFLLQLLGQNFLKLLNNFDGSGAMLLLLLFEFLTSQISAGKHSPILGFNNQQE
jgi:hypothetical protein